VGITVKLKEDGRVDCIERTDGNWIDKGKDKDGKLPSLPEYLNPFVNKYQGVVSIDMEIIAPSGQQWNQVLTGKQRNELLELVEWVGDDADEYTERMISMWPKEPRRK